MSSDTIQKQRNRGGKRQLYGESEITTCDLWMYVNPDGDDAGDVGDADHPFATVTRAMERIAARYKHHLGIIVAGGDYPAGAWPSKIDNIREPGGLLMVVCPDGPVDHKKDVEITDAEQLNGGAWRLEFGAESWDEHELSGYWLAGTDDNDDPFLLAIADNTTDTIFLRPGGSDPALVVGLVVDVKRPAAMFTCNEPPIIQVRDHAGETCYCEEESFAPLAIVGIGIDCSGVSDVQQWAIEGGGASLYAQCVQIIGTVDGYGSHLRDVSINAHLPDAPTILAWIETLYPGASKVDQGPGLCLADSDGAAGLYYVFGGEMSIVKGLVTAGCLEFSGLSTPNAFANSSAHNIFASGGSVVYAQNVLFVGLDPLSAAVYLGSINGSAEMACYECYTLSGANAFNVSVGSFLQLTDCDCDPVGVTGVAVVVASGGRVVPYSLAFDMLGDDGAYDNGNGAVLAWPDDETTIHGGEQIIDIPAVDSSLSALDGRVTALEQGAETPPTQDSTGLKTWVNQGGATVAELPIGLSIHAPASATENLRILKKAAPAAPYEITARVKLMSPTGTYFSVGIGWRDPGTGKLETVALDSQNAMQVGVFRRSDPQTWVSETVAYNTTYWREVWLRIADDGTNRICSFSLDGENFIAFDSVAKAAGYLGAAGYAEIVFYTNCFNAGAQCWGTLLSYLEDVGAI